MMNFDNRGLLDTSEQKNDDRQEDNQDDSIQDESFIRKDDFDQHVN